MRIIEIILWSLIFVLCRSHGVEKMYRLERLPPPVQSAQRVYIVRPALVTLKYVADHVHSDKLSHPDIQ